MSARDDYPPKRYDQVQADQWERMCREIDQLRELNRAWMNGVADVVEWMGYDRNAACGPADLLPGLATLVEYVRETMDPDGDEMITWAPS